MQQLGRSMVQGWLQLVAVAALALPAVALADEATPLEGDGGAPTEAAATEEGQVPRKAVARPESEVRLPVSLPEMVEQMMVTARKREESLQRTPVAVTAYSAQEIVSANLRRLSDIESRVPNLQFDNALGSANSGRLTIRGVGQGDLIGTADPGVAIYIDGVYTPRAQGQLRALLNVERIETLRGPQGTLFGKNTVGGAVNVVTKRPEFALGGEAELRAGNFGMIESRVAVNLPIVAERATARISFATNYDEGYQSNVITGRRGGTDRLLSTRADLLLVPTQDTEVLLSADLSRERRRPQAGRCFVSNPLALPDIFSVQAACARTEGLSHLKFASDVSAKDELDSWGLTGRFSWDIDSTTSFRSITAVRHQDLSFEGDGDGSGANFFQPQLGPERTEQRLISHEMQVEGRLLGGRLSYVVGGYAFGETVTENPLGALFFPKAQQNGFAVLEETLKVNNRTLAGYGQASFAITSDLNLTLGIRRTVERKRVRKRDEFQTSGLLLQAFLAGQLVPVAAGTRQFEFEASERFDKWTPMATLAYDLSPNTLVYVSYSEGFRSGGFNGRANITNLDVSPVSPEDLTTYEVGLKTTLLEDRLQINASAFSTKYEDIQRTIITLVNGNGAAVVRNAAEAILRGGELEIVAVPVTGLTLSSAIGVFKGRYTDFDFINDPSIADARFARAPNLTINLAVEYETPIGSLGVLSSRLEWSQRGKQANDALDTRQIRSGRYGILDGRLALKRNDGQTELAVFGENLLNREFFNNGVDLSQLFGYLLRFPGEPRRYGIEVRRSF